MFVVSDENVLKYYWYGWKSMTIINMKHTRWVRFADIHTRAPYMFLLN